MATQNQAHHIPNPEQDTQALLPPGQRPIISKETSQRKEIPTASLTDRVSDYTQKHHRLNPHWRGVFPKFGTPSKENLHLAIVGESHSHSHHISWLIRQLPIMKQEGVKLIFLESPQSQQKLIDSFQKALASKDQQQIIAVRNDLNKVSAVAMRPQVIALIENALKIGMQVVCTDSERLAQPDRKGGGITIGAFDTAKPRTELGGGGIADTSFHNSTMSSGIATRMRSNLGHGLFIVGASHLRLANDIDEMIAKSGIKPTVVLARGEQETNVDNQKGLTKIVSTARQALNDANGTKSFLLPLPVIKDLNKTSRYSGGIQLLVFPQKSDTGSIIEAVAPQPTKDLKFSDQEIIRDLYN